MDDLRSPWCLHFWNPAVLDWTMPIRLAVEAGPSWLRFNVNWSRVETARGVYDYGQREEALSAFDAAGIETFGNLGASARAWTPDFDYGTPLNDPQARRAWERFTDDTVSRFGGSIRWWEVHNEPNLRQFWQPTPDAAEYVAFLKASRERIRMTRPDAKVVFGGTSVIPLAFIRRCLDAGAAGHMDAFNFHPYRPLPEASDAYAGEDAEVLRSVGVDPQDLRTYADEVAALRRLLASYGFTGPIWQGENGFPSEAATIHYNPAGVTCSPVTQAKYVGRRMISDWVAGCAVSTLFQLVEADTAFQPYLTDGRAKMSATKNTKGIVVNETLEPKPAYFALRRLCRVLRVPASTRPTAVACDVVSRGGFCAGKPCDAPQAYRWRQEATPVLAYWWPSQMADDPREGEVRCDVDFADWRDPVVLDLSDGRTFEVGGTLPLTDAVRVVVERDAV